MTHIVAINHHRRDRHAAVAPDLHRVERLDDAGYAALLEGLNQLHDQFAAAHHRRIRGDQTEPWGAAVAAAVRIVTHIRCASESGQSAQGDGGGIRVGIHLQRRTDEQIDTILAGQLA